LQTIDQLNAVYAAVASDTNAIVAPLGRAWVTAVKESSINLYIDYVHPTRAATYLGACVFYATLFGKSPEGLPSNPWNDRDLASDIGAGGVSYLQALAWKTVAPNRAATVLAFDFGTATSAVAAGYTRATDAAYDPSVGFGWIAGDRWAIDDRGGLGGPLNCD